MAGRPVESEKKFFTFCKNSFSADQNGLTRNLCVWSTSILSYSPFISMYVAALFQAWKRVWWLSPFVPMGNQISILSSNTYPRINFITPLHHSAFFNYIIRFFLVLNIRWKGLLENLSSICATKTHVSSLSQSRIYQESEYCFMLTCRWLTCLCWQLIINIYQWGVRWGAPVCRNSEIFLAHPDRF